MSPIEIIPMRTSPRPGSLLVSLLCRTLAVGLLALGVSAASLAAVAVSVTIAPPALPVYAQPICPGPGYIWTPGYWAYGPYGYYWVPGTWVLAPYTGALWTPGYWGWASGFYVWHAGYWGPRVGYYGGINYGFGYTGVGFVGGYWAGGVYRYNTAVSNVNVNVVHNTYNRAVIENTTNVSRVSYNGGAGGINHQPTNEERLATGDRHRAATSTQLQHERLASTDRGQRASANNGNPGTMATPRPAFRDRGAGAPGGQNAGAPRHAQQADAMRGGPQAQPQGQGGQHQGAGGQHRGQGQGQARGDGRGGPQGGERGQHQGQGGGERHEGGGPR